MKKSKLPKLLIDWLEAREIYPADMTENEIYSAACELLDDIATDYDYMEALAQQKQAIARFVDRESKTHTRLPLGEWY